MEELSANAGRNVVTNCINRIRNVISSLKVVKWHFFEKFYVKIEQIAT